jgi:hypothetical protein
MERYTVTGNSIELQSGRIALSDDIVFHRKHLLKPTEEDGVYEILGKMAFKKGQSFGYEGPELGRNVLVNVNDGQQAVPTPLAVEREDTVENQVSAFSGETITVAEIAKERNARIFDVVDLLADYNVTVTRGADEVPVERWHQIKADLDTASEDDGDEETDDEDEDEES